MTTALSITAGAYQPDGAAIARLGQTVVLDLQIAEPGDTGPFSPAALDGRFFVQRLLDRNDAVLAEVEPTRPDDQTVRFTLTLTEGIMPASAKAADLTHVIVELLEEGEDTVLTAPFSVRRLREGLPAAAMTIGEADRVTVRYVGAPGRSAAQQAHDAGHIDAATPDALAAWLREPAVTAGAAADAIVQEWAGLLPSAEAIHADALDVAAKHAEVLPASADALAAAAQTLGYRDATATLKAFAEQAAAAALAHLIDALAVQALGDNATAIAARAAKSANGDDFLDKAAVLQNLIYRAEGADAVDRPARDKMLEVRSTLDHGGVQGIADVQTTAVQAALDALPPSATLNNPLGVKFSRKALTLPKNGWMVYYADDNVDAPAFGTQRASGERIRLSFNSSFGPDNLNGAAVNEERLTSPWATGHIVDTLTDVLGHDAHLGDEQDREEDPALAFRIWAIDGVNMFGAIARSAWTANAFDGMQFYAYRNAITLNGVGTDAGGWAVTPVVGALLTGAESGARGVVASVTAGAIVVIWKRGTFVAGEAVVHAGETSASVIAGEPVEVQKAQPTLTQSYRTGHWAIDIPAEKVLDKFAVGGLIVSAGSRDSGQHAENGHITLRGFMCVDTYEPGDGNPVRGMGMVYDTNLPLARRRLVEVRYGETTPRAHLGAVRAYANFAVSMIVPSSAFNVASITRTAGQPVGDFLVTFIVAFDHASYTAIPTASMFADCPTAFVVTKETLRIQNFNRAGVLADPVGRLHFVCLGGDITP